MPRFILLVVLFHFTPLASAAPPDFEKHIAPLLSSHCLSCHSGPKPKGDLDLTRKANVLNGTLVQPKNPEASELLSRVLSDEMPPKKPLSAGEKKLLSDWIANGASWGGDPINPIKYTTTNRAGLDWWSLKPVIAHDPPKLADHPIDAFLEKKRQEMKLTASKPTDRRTLIRRMYFDVIGLPPTPEEVAEFEKDDSPQAVKTLISKLLASPHYGERWARHWLDVVRFGESQGFERNDPRLTAWHYRDWVIRAFNKDMPYDQFTRWQLAGDVLKPEDGDAIRATGYLVAGIHNTVLPALESAKQLARQDELEDIVGNISQVFLGLSAHCARCHDHKFDPISQVDYYRMASLVSGVRHEERLVETPEQRKRSEELRTQLAQHQQEIYKQQEPTRQKLLADRGKKGQAPGPQPLLAWNFDDAQPSEKLTLHGGARLTPEGLVLNGTTAFARSKPIPQTLREKTLEAWVKLDNLSQRGGGVITLQTPDGVEFDSIVFAEQQVKHWMAGSNFYKRTRPFNGPEETTANREPVHIAITYHASGAITAYRNGVLYGQHYRSSGPVSFQQDKAVVVFGVRHEPAGDGRLLKGTIVRARLYDRALSPEEISRSSQNPNQVSELEILNAMPEEVRKEAQAMRRKQIALQKQQAELETQRTQKIFANVPSQPPVTRLLVRGQVTDPQGVISPGGLQALPDSDFQLAENSPEAERRKRLAAWITSAKNPLFARVMVNRMWHYHFGVGLVDSPNDFGFNGGRPSHPELLDYLAHRFQQDGYSLKSLHKLILTSQAYQLASANNADAAKIDAESRYLWRKRPQRLEAEALRDAMLHASGLLNPKIGGQGFLDYKMISNSGTMYYEPFDPVGAEFHRRSIYRFVPRGGNPGLLEAFDCPDSAGSAARRASTTTPLQALSLWNGPFALRMSEAFAYRLVQEKYSPAEQVQRAYEIAYQRSPTKNEASQALQVVKSHGLRVLTRVLLNSNEFLMID